MSFSSFIASIIATVWPFLTVSPTLTLISKTFPPIGAKRVVPSPLLTGAAAGAASAFGASI